jgi:mRNA-degrading endonuclease RelE of RelBE toxin-antitoxin system
MEIRETKGFTEWVAGNGLQSQFNALSLELAANPTKGDVVRGTGGLRKVRMKGKGKGKSGGYRVIYFLIVNHDTLVCLGGYSKSESEDLSVDEYAELETLSAACTKQIADEKKKKK